VGSQGTSRLLKDSSDCGSSTRVGSTRGTSRVLTNREVIASPFLSGKGLDGYRAQRVVNSRWLAELEAINSVHHCHKPEVWRKRSHYVLWFHDSTFECVAESFRVELFRESMADLLVRVCQRLFS